MPAMPVVHGFLSTTSLPSNHGWIWRCQAFFEFDRSADTFFREDLGFGTAVKLCTDKPL